MEPLELNIVHVALLIVFFVIMMNIAHFRRKNNNNTARWDNCEIAKQCGVSVRLIQTSEECINSIKDLLASNPPVLGFDCEWKPYFDSDKSTNPVSLLQLSNQHICLLIRLKDISESKTGIPQQLIHLLINPQLRH